MENIINVVNFFSNASQKEPRDINIRCLNNDAQITICIEGMGDFDRKAIDELLYNICGQVSVKHTVSKGYDGNREYNYLGIQCSNESSITPIELMESLAQFEKVTGVSFVIDALADNKAQFSTFNGIGINKNMDRLKQTFDNTKLTKGLFINICKNGGSMVNILFIHLSED